MTQALLSTPFKSNYQWNFRTVNYAQKAKAAETLAWRHLMQPIYYLAGILGMSLIGAVSIVCLEIFRPEGYNTAAAYTIIGYLTPTCAALVVGLRSIANGQKIDHMHVCAHDIKEEVVAAKEVAIETKREVIQAVGGSGLNINR